MIPLKDRNRSKTFPFISILLIIINVLIFFYELSVGENLDSLIRAFGAIPARISFLHNQNPLNLITSQFTLITSMFLHGGWLHLIGNMWYLWIFGDNVEDSMGHGRFLLFYFLCGIIAGLLNVYLNSHSTIPTVGASGAIAGVMGAYIVQFPRAKILTLLPIFIFIYFVDIPAIFFLGFWILIQFFYGISALSITGEIGGVAWWAHIGGFLSGIIFIFLFRKTKVKVKV